ncbi:MAG: ParA family protein [Clostridia bacterium]|nr:ParA family protein [Clostridia bacterium]
MAILPTKAPALSPIVPGADTTVITVAVTKGGVAKTTTAVNLAAEMGMHGFRTLLVDMDEQGNTTLSATGKNREAFNNAALFDAYRTFGFPGCTTDHFIHTTQLENVDIIPCSGFSLMIPDQAQILHKTRNYPEYAFLSAILQNIENTHYDFVVIDTPPGKNTFSLSGIYAADQIIIPLHPDKYSIDSLNETYRLIETINRENEMEINILGILLTIVEKVNFTKVLRENLQTGDYSGLKLKTEIRKGQAVNDATLGGPVVIEDPRSNPAKDYKELFTEVMERLAAYKAAQNHRKDGE